MYICTNKLLILLKKTNDYEKIQIYQKRDDADCRLDDGKL